MKKGFQICCLFFVRYAILENVLEIRIDFALGHHFIIVAKFLSSEHFSEVQCYPINDPERNTKTNIFIR